MLHDVILLLCLLYEFLIIRLSLSRVAQMLLFKAASHLGELQEISLAMTDE